MSWLGSWLGGGTGSAPAAPVPLSQRPKGALERCLAVLQIEFVDDDVQPSFGVGTSGGRAVMVLKVDSERLPTTGQSLRISVQVTSQAENLVALSELHDRAMEALRAADTVLIISEEEGADVWDDETASGVYRRFSTLEIRA